MCEPTLGEMITSLGDHTTDPNRPFVGNHWFQGERGKTEVKGICFRDLADCVVKAFVNSVETTDELSQRANDGTLNYNDLYTLDLSQMDPVALLLNICCRVEMAMEIYPNVNTTNDPCQFMLHDGITSTPTVHRSGCYICEDQEFAQMGLPLCYPCKFCGGHVAADDTVCDDCEKKQ